MNILYTGQAKKIRIPGHYDPEEVRSVTWIFRPPTWTTATVYLKDEVIIPTVFSGVYLKVVHPGKSGATEPVWDREAEKQTADGTLGLVFECADYDMLDPSVTITAAAYTTTNSVIATAATPAFTATTGTCTISALPAAAVAAGEFEVMGHFTKSTTEVFDSTLVFEVGDN